MYHNDRYIKRRLDAKLDVLTKVRYSNMQLNMLLRCSTKMLR